MRIGINIPDDLVKRLGPFKSFINISQVCRDALHEYVRLRERAQDQTVSDGADKPASRLSGEKTPVAVDWELFGLHDAKLWSSLASNDEWDLIFDRLDYFEAQGKSPFDSRIPIPRVKGAKNYYDRQYEVDVDKGWFEQQIALDVQSNPYVVAQTEYQRGFYAYIVIIRQKVREMLTANLRAQEENTRQMKSELKSKVEVPKALKD